MRAVAGTLGGLGAGGAPGQADRERIALNFAVGFCAGVCSAGWQRIGLCDDSYSEVWVPRKEIL